MRHPQLLLLLLLLQQQLLLLQMPAGQKAQHMSMFAGQSMIAVLI
jgi:hypothetical protein